MWPISSAISWAGSASITSFDLEELALLHQELDHVDGALGHAVGELLDGDRLGDDHLAQIFSRGPCSRARARSRSRRRRIEASERSRSLSSRALTRVSLPRRRSSARLTGFGLGRTGGLDAAAEAGRTLLLLGLGLSLTSLRPRADADIRRLGRLRLLGAAEAAAGGVLGALAQRSPRSCGGLLPRPCGARLPRARAAARVGLGGAAGGGLLGGAGAPRLRAPWHRPARGRGRRSRRRRAGGAPGRRAGCRRRRRRRRAAVRTGARRAGRRPARRGRTGAAGSGLRPRRARQAALLALDLDHVGAAVREALAHGVALDAALQRQRRLLRSHAQRLVAGDFWFRHTFLMSCGRFTKFSRDAPPTSSLTEKRGESSDAREHIIARRPREQCSMYHICPAECQIQLLAREDIDDHGQVDVAEPRLRRAGELLQRRPAAASAAWISASTVPWPSAVSTLPKPATAVPALRASDRALAAAAGSCAGDPLGEARRNLDRLAEAAAETDASSRPSRQGPLCRHPDAAAGKTAAEVGDDRAVRRRRRSGSVAAGGFCSRVTMQVRSVVSSLRGKRAPP